MAFHDTSNSDFDKEGCVIQVEWTKAVCDNCQPMLLTLIVLCVTIVLFRFLSKNGTVF